MYWNSSRKVGRYTQIEANFTLFFGLAVQLYEATLVSDDTPFDRFLKDPSFVAPFTSLPLAILPLFVVPIVIVSHALLFGWTRLPKQADARSHVVR